MKLAIMLQLLLVSVITCFAQQGKPSYSSNNSDSVLVLTHLEAGHDNGPRYTNSFTSSTETQIFVKENVAISTSNLKLSAIEKEISSLEEMESKALLNRDTLMLKKLWIRDFTKDIPENRANGKSALPHYLKLSRMIERVNVNGNSVFTSGYESYLILRPNVPLGDPIKRYYFHVWTKKNGQWKLISRSAN